MTTLGAYEVPAHVEASVKPASIDVWTQYQPANVGPRSAETIAATLPRGWLSIADTGATVLIVDGKIMEMPPREQERESVKPEVDHGHPLVVFGVGSGHSVHMLRAYSGAPVLVYEPDPGIARRFLDVAYNLPGVTVCCDRQEFEQLFQCFLRGADCATVIAAPPYQEMFAEEHAWFGATINRLLAAEKVTLNTIERRMPEWIKNVLGNLSQVPGTVPAMRMAGAFKGVPAFIVGAGPSLNKNGHLLAECAKRGLVFAIDVSARPIANHGCKPHLFITVEGRDLSAHLDGVPWIDEVPRLFTLEASQATFRIGKGPLMPWADSNFPFIGLCRDVLKAEGLPIGGSVTTAAFLFAEAFGCNPIVMVGQDLLNTEGARAAEGVHGLAELEPHGMAVPWGGGEPVQDHVQWLHTRVWFEQRAARLQEKGGPRLINATEGGSRIDRFEELPLADVLAELPERDVEVPIGEHEPVSGEVLQGWLSAQIKDLRAASPAAQLCSELCHRVAEMLADGATTEELEPVMHERNEAEMAFRRLVQEQYLFTGWTQTEVKALNESRKTSATGVEAAEAAVRLRRDGHTMAALGKRAAEFADMLEGVGE